MNPAPVKDGLFGNIESRILSHSWIRWFTELVSKVVTTDDSRLSDARTPTAHANTHQNGGGDEVATATPAANAIPKAGAAGTLASGWIPDLSTTYAPAAKGVTNGDSHDHAYGDGAQIPEAGITLQDTILLNVSTTKHGFVPKAPNDNTKGLLGTDGTWGIVGYSPIGSIIAWHKSFANTPALPSNWVECNGQTLSDAGSVYNGQVIPNLNGSASGADLNNGDNLGKTGNVFLRGDETSGATQFDNIQGHIHDVGIPLDGSGTAKYKFTYSGVTNNAPSFSAGSTRSPIDDGTNGTPRTGTTTRPRNMSVVWIMRIK